MQKHEVKKILEQLINLYPSMKLTKDTAAIWVECLQDISYENAYNNLLEHAKNSQYAPTIANIRGSNKKDNKEKFNDYCETTGRVYEFVDLKTKINRR